MEDITANHQNQINHSSDNVGRGLHGLPGWFGVLAAGPSMRREKCGSDRSDLHPKADHKFTLRIRVPDGLQIEIVFLGHTGHQQILYPRVETRGY